MIKQALRRASMLHQYVPVLLIGLFFHLFNFSKASFFYADQGNDLLIARAILEDDHRPLVGPLLSAAGVYVPPTYYYLLAAFLAVGKTPLGTAVVFFIFNMMTMVGLMIIGEKLVDRKTGIIAGLLFSTTVVVQEHGRYMWQPHPVLWLETGTLLCFLLAKEQKRVIWLFFGALCYILAVSVYPSALLLVFYVWYQVVRLYRLVTGESIGAALMFVLSTHFILGGLVYAPFFVFEYANGFPTYQALFSGSFGVPFSMKETIYIYAQNFVTFVESLTNQANILRSHSDLLATALIGSVFMLWGWLQRKGALRREWVNFVGLPWIFLGWLGVLFYRLEIFHWRSWYLLPLWLLVFSLVIRVGLAKRQFVIAWTVVVLVFFYVWGNLLRFYRWTVLHPLNSIEHTRTVATTITSSAQENGYDPEDIGVVSFTPSDEQTSWEAPPLLYFLHEDMELPVSITREGNNVETWNAVYFPKPIKYLVCSEYASIEWIQEGCVGKFIKTNKAYVQKERWLLDDNTVVFLYARSTGVHGEN